MGDPGFWDDNDSAQKTVSDLKSLKSIVGPMDELTSSVEDLAALFEMAEEDESIAEEVTGEIVRLEKILEELELKALLNGPNDSAGAILSINARDGGTDANDWADMMLRMYSLKVSYSMTCLIGRKMKRPASIMLPLLCVVRWPTATSRVKKACTGW